MSSVYYEEIFASIQGESTDTGKPCVFVRLHGCPIGCSYCDQKQDKSSRRRISITNIEKQVRRFKGIDEVCITGGEPLIYGNDLMQIVYCLQGAGKNVSIETSGCFEIEDVPYQRSYRYIMDVKCPSSDVSDKNILDNLLILRRKDDVIFAVSDREDYEFAKNVLKKYPTLATVFFSPVFDEEMKPVINTAELTNWIIEDRLKCRIQIQLHKILGVQ